jgi:hypothetical protein
MTELDSAETHTSKRAHFAAQAPIMISHDGTRKDPAGRRTLYGPPRVLDLPRKSIPRACGLRLYSPSRSPQMLKKIIIGISTAFVVATFAVPAMAAQYCANYQYGAKNCGFHSWEQCQAAVNGIGGFCQRSS